LSYICITYVIEEKHSLDILFNDLTLS